MKNSIILHGRCDKDEYYSDAYPSLSNSHWLPWLQKQLLMKDIITQTPEMPEAYSPDYSKWKKEFEKFSVNKDSILVGHSCGAGFLLRWLTENKVKINKLVLVAPWLDPNRRKVDTFFDFKLDRKIQERINEIHLFVSEDEKTEGVKKSVKDITDTLPLLTTHHFKNMGHFCFGDMKTDRFPELLDCILK